MNEQGMTDRGTEALNASVAAHVARGWRVEMQTSTSAVLVSGAPVNHVLHLILTLVTCGLWGFVWLIMAFTQKESRVTLNLDRNGVVHSTTPASSS